MTSKNILRKKKCERWERENEAWKFIESYKLWSIEQKILTNELSRSHGKKPWLKRYVKNWKIVSFLLSLNNEIKLTKKNLF